MVESVRVMKPARWAGHPPIVMSCVTTIKRVAELGAAGGKFQLGWKINLVREERAAYLLCQFLEQLFILSKPLIIISRRVSKS